MLEERKKVNRDIQSESKQLSNAPFQINFIIALFRTRPSLNKLLLIFMNTNGYYFSVFRCQLYITRISIAGNSSNEFIQKIFIL